MEHFVLWMVFLMLWTINLIFWGTIHFWGWVFDDLDNILGIFDGDYAIWDDFLAFELTYFVFLLVYLVCWARHLIFGNTSVCILDDVLSFLSFLGFWDGTFLGPNCPGTNLPLFQVGQLGPGQPGPGAQPSGAQLSEAQLSGAQFA